MPMRDYEDLKNLKIPAEQERIMDIEAGYAPVKWIDVNDRLPELEETVLVLDRRGNKMVRTLRKLSSEKEPSFRPDGLVPQKHITHWMPIPDPPEVEE